MTEDAQGIARTTGSVLVSGEGDKELWIGRNLAAREMYVA